MKCCKIFDLFVDNTVCSIFSGIDWTGVVPFGPASGSFSGNMINISATGPGIGMGGNGWQGSGTLNYAGPQIDCTIEVISLSGFAVELGIFQDNNATQLLNWNWSLGIGVYPFTILATAGSILYFSGTPGTGSVIMSAQDADSCAVEIKIGS